MSTGLLRLTAGEIAKLNVLFLARFAPGPGDAPPPLDPVDGLFPRYNHELWSLLQSLGVSTTSCRDPDEFVRIIKNYNFLFSIYNRIPMRNPEVFPSSMCEYLGIPYLGAPPNIRILAEDKYLTKALAGWLGIPAPPGAVFDNAGQPHDPPGFDGPYFVKPRFGAASEDVSTDSIQSTWDGTWTRVTQLLGERKDVLVERCITGTDITVPVLGGNPPIILPPMHEISDLPGGIVTFKQKRCIESGRVRKVLPDRGLIAELKQYVGLLCRHVFPFDYLRVDFRLQEDTNRLFLLEFNICCNLGSHAAIAESARARDISHQDLINHILSFSVRRQGPRA